MASISTKSDVIDGTKDGEENDAITIKVLLFMGRGTATETAKSCYYISIYRFTDF